LSKDYTFEELKALFAADLSQKMKVLQDAVGNGSWETISRISHQIKGTAKSFGFTNISALAAELEQSIAQNRLELAPGLVKKISDASVL